MESIITRMDKELFNGEGGLVKSVPVLANNVEKLSNSVNELRTVMSGIKKYVFEDVGGKKKEEEIKKIRLTNFQISGIIMGAIVGLFSILGFIRSMTSAKQIDRLDYKMYFKQDKIPDSTTRSIKSLPLDTARLFK